MSKRTRSAVRWLVILLLLGIGAWRELDRRGDHNAGSPSASTTTADGEAAILAAHRAQRSDVWVEARAVVDRTLADDNKGSRHQRFIARLPSGHTVLISHNIDLAERIPLGKGDPLAFRGEYEWNDRGGVVHWTHHDPQGRHEGGWIEHDGRRYR